MRVVIERGASAKTADRTQFTAPLDYCEKHPRELDLLVVYDLTRFARSQEDHLVVRGMLARCGIGLRSVTEPVDESPEGRLVEGIFASLGDYDNLKRKRRSIAGMKDLARGRWVW